MKKFLASIGFLINSLLLMSQNLQSKLIQTISGEKYGFVNSAGEVVIKPLYDKVFEFRDGYSPVVKGEKMGLIDTLGNEIIPFKYADIGYLQEGLIPACMEKNKYGYIDSTDKVVIPFMYEETYLFVDGLGIVKKNGKYGMINDKNVVVVPCKYVKMYNMIDGIAMVCAKSDGVDDLGNIEYKNFWGFVNDKGVEISQMNCDGDVSKNLGNGYAAARTSFVNGFAGSGGGALIDKNGKIIIPESMRISYEIPYENFMMVSKDYGDLVGFMDYSGKEIFPIKFSKISEFEWVNDDLYLAEVFFRDNKSFFINDEFKCVEFNNKPCPQY
jgi:hypothetical protein